MVRQWIGFKSSSFKYNKCVYILFENQRALEASVKKYSLADNQESSAMSIITMDRFISSVVYLIVSPFLNKSLDTNVACQKNDERRFSKVLAF